MEGTVTSFLPGKGYGFVRGDDGRDYYLHASDCECAEQVIEGRRVGFEEAATPKGYRARRVRVVPLTGDTRYRVPGEVISSRSQEVRDWQILEASRWTLHGSSRDSPDEANDILRANASRVGANGLVGVRYYKTRGSEAGTGRGTHYYTIHNFSGTPVALGCASTNGTHTLDTLRGLDSRALQLKQQLAAKTRASKSAAWTAVGACFLILFSMAFAIGRLNPVVLLVALCIGTLIGGVAYRAIAKDHDSWLQPPPLESESATSATARVV